MYNNRLHSVFLHMYTFSFQKKMAGGPSTTFDLFADSSTDLFNDCKNYEDFKDENGLEEKSFEFQTKNENKNCQNASNMIPDDSQDEFIKESGLFDHIFKDQNVSSSATLASTLKQKVKVQQTISQALAFINDTAVSKKNSTRQKNRKTKNKT